MMKTIQDNLLSFIAAIYLFLLVNQNGFKLSECTSSGSNGSQLVNNESSSAGNSSSNSTQLTPEQLKELKNVIRDFQIKKFKKKILKLLSMTEPPKFSNKSLTAMNAKHFLPAYLIDEINQANKKTIEKDKEEEMILVIKPIETCLQEVVAVCFVVDILGRVPRRSLISAKIVSDIVENSLRGINIELWEIRMVNTRVRVSTRLAVTEVGDNNAISLDFTNKLAHWLRNQETRPTTQRKIARMFAIVCPHCVQYDAPLPVVVNKTILTIKYRPMAKRVKREAKTNDGVCNYFLSCCRKSVTFEVAAIGWHHFIAYPTVFTVNYCMGSCRQITQSSHYLHSLLVRDYRDSATVEAANKQFAEICCSPKSYSSFTLIYLEADATLIKRTFPDFVVDDCICA